MLNMISSLASLSQTLRTSHSKPTAADSSTHTPQSSPSASTASISEQGQAMLVQSRMATQQTATAEQARLAEEARAQFAVPKWLAEMNPAPYLNAELGGSEWSGTQNSPEKMSWWASLSPEQQHSRLEFQEKLHGYYAQFVDEQKFSSEAERYQRMIGDAASSQRMHNQFREIILGDKRMIELASSMNWQI